MTADTVHAHLTAAQRALQSGAYDEAIKGFEAVLQRQPAHASALAGASRAYRFFNRGDRIVELYHHAYKADPGDPEIAAGYVEALLGNAETQKARAVAEEAIPAHPDFLRLRLLHAQTDLIEGNREAARATFWACLKQDPDNVDCVYQLAQITPEDELPRLAERLDTMWAARDARDPWDAATLGYAYGRVAERQKDYEKAWSGFAFGAEKRRSLVQFDETILIRSHDAHSRSFSAATPSVDEETRPGAGYVFIVSLPRSGSTLVEQILDAHPQAEAIGERSIVNDAVTRWQREFGSSPQGLFAPNALRAARDAYTKPARALVGTGTKVIVDKSITNYLFLGFLRTILPGARFVHVVRDPLDTAVSCFATSFFAGNEWTYDLAEIGRNMRRYQKLMTHWMAQWPDDILTVRYEALVDRPEDLSREIVAFCGLEWSAACLDFHKSKRPVMTASLNQVRQPIYTTARGRATHYESHLGPLRAALGRRAADPDWCRPAAEKR